MTTLHDLLKQSVLQYQQLYEKITSIRRRLPLLDFLTTVQEKEDLDLLFEEIQETDRQILAVLDSVDIDLYTDLLEQRLELGHNVLAQYQEITPKLLTRLAGYRTELLKIRHGLQTIGGYATPSSNSGQLINTCN